MSQGNQKSADSDLYIATFYTGVIAHNQLEFLQLAIAVKHSIYCNVLLLFPNTIIT